MFLFYWPEYGLFNREFFRGDIVSFGKLAEIDVHHPALTGRKEVLKSVFRWPLQPGLLNGHFGELT